MAIPLKKTIHYTALAVSLVLVALLGLGVRQYQLYSNHARITGQTEKLIFQFAIIREHVGEALLDGQYAGLAAVAAELEGFNRNLTGLMHDRHIDDQYKLSFANSLDLPGLILLVRKIEAGPEKAEYVRQLNREIRVLGERLMLFDRVLVDHAKRQLVGFQNVVIGALALVVFLVILLLFFFQKRLIFPLLALVAQVKEVASGRRGGLSIADRNDEISDLAYSFHDLLSAREITAQGLARFQRLAAAIKRAQLALSKARDEESLFREVCRALLVNEDYCLVWIGRASPSGEDVLPVSADGSTTMTGKECETCVALLLTEAEEKGLEFNPAAMALRSGRPVVKSDILAGIPKGLLKGTPLAAGYASCAALPVARQGQVYAVLSVYGVSRDGFAEKEIELLEGLTADLALALYTVHEQQRLARKEKLHAGLLAALDLIRLNLAPSGEILAANEVFSRRTGLAPEAITGRGVAEFFRPATAGEASEAESFMAWLAAEKSRVLQMAAGVVAQGWQCALLPGREEDGAPGELVLLGYPRQGEEKEEEGGLEWLRLETMAGLAEGGCHEISDLSNGLINYAQVLVDEESSRSPRQPHNALLAKILDGGERIAEMVRKLIFYGQRQGDGGEFLSAAVVLDDALLLSGYHLRSDGIQLEVRLEPLPPEVPVHAQRMQLAFLGLLNLMRHALNKRFPGRNPRKKISIESRIATFGGAGRVYEIILTDWGASLPVDVLEAGTGSGSPGKGKTWVGFTEKLAACRRIVEEQGGVFALEAEEGDSFVRLRLSLPVKND